MKRPFDLPLGLKTNPYSPMVQHHRNKYVAFCLTDDCRDLVNIQTGKAVKSWANTKAKIPLMYRHWHRDYREGSLRISKWSSIPGSSIHHALRDRRNDLIMTVYRPKTVGKVIFRHIVRKLTMKQDSE